MNFRRNVAARLECVMRSISWTCFATHRARHFPRQSAGLGAGGSLASPSRHNRGKGALPDTQLTYYNISLGGKGLGDGLCAARHCACRKSEVHCLATPIANALDALKRLKTCTFGNGQGRPRKKEKDSKTRRCVQEKRLRDLGAQVFSSEGGQRRSRLCLRVFLFASDVRWRQRRRFATRQRKLCSMGHKKGLVEAEGSMRPS